VGKVPADERGTAIAAAVGAVAGNAGLVVESFPGGDGLGVSAEGVSLGFGAVALTEAEGGSGEES
jgi:hypothetical protein